MIARDDLVDHGDPDRRQIDTSFVQPDKEAIDRSATAFDRGIGPSTLAGHARRKGRNLVRMRVTAGRPGFFEPAQKAQPALSVAEESSTCARS